MKNEKWYVTMTDKAMSGWGRAKDMTNKLIITCDNLQDAETVERNALRRPEMKYVNITRIKPRSRAGVLLSWKEFKELGDIWKR